MSQITDDTQARSLAHSRQLQEVLVELLRAEPGDLDETLARLSAVAGSALGVARTSVWKFNEPHTELRCLHLFDQQRNTVESGAVLDATKVPNYFATLELSRVIAAEDARTHPGTREFTETYLDVLGITSMLDVPLRHEGHTVGVLCFEHIGPRRAWTHDEQNFAASLADLTSLVFETDRSRKTLERLKLLRQSDRAILTLGSLEEIANAALDKLKQLVPCRRASVAVLDPDGVTTRIVGVLTDRSTRLGVGSAVPLGVVNNVESFRKGQPNILTDLASGTRHSAHAALAADGIRTLANVPLIANGELMGSLNLGSVKPSAFSQEDIEIAQEVADSLAVVIEHTRLLRRTEQHAAELERRVAERTRELRESEDRIRSLYDNTPVMMHSINDQGMIVDVNQYWLDNTGYQRHEVIGRPVSDFAAPESRDYVRNVMFPKLIRDGFIRDAHVKGQKKNGELLDIEISSIFRRDADGRPLQSQAFLLDVTERNRAERARKEVEERLAAVFRSAMDAILVIGQDRRIVSFNPAAEKVFGCAAADAVDGPIGRFLSEEFGQILQGAMESPDGAGAKVWVPKGLRAIRKNGEQFRVEATVSRTDISNARLFTIILRDVDERERAAEMLDQLQRENVYLQEEIRSEFEEIIGASPVMERVFHSVEMVAQTDSTVLLLGETGTGKELLARAIHNRSRRKQSVMVKVNCAALPANLVESELFGHEKGSFTGAIAQKKGRFELAHRGTLFLDEIGELPLETQIKLLRVLQEQEFERIGGSQTIKVDVRVVAATNRDLEEEVRKGTFRADLYYRLNVFPVEVPPLRERKADIPLLANHFARKFSQRMGKRIDSIQRSFLDQLMSYDWPGNVRELANLMERAVIFCQDDTLHAKHLATIRMAAPKSAASGPEPLPTMDEAERRLIRRALDQAGGILAGPKGAATLLGVNRSTLWSRMRKLGIDMQKKGASAAD